MAVESRPALETVLRFYKQTHERLLSAAEGLKPGQFAHSAGTALHSVAWQLWHAARWDDFFGAHVQADFGREPSSEVWAREGLAERWRLTAGTMGRRDTGTNMEEAAADQMRFPPQAEVIAYARETFAFTLAAISAIPEDQLDSVAKADPDGDTYLDNILIYFSHLNRHLGMIEAIRGLNAGVPGSTDG